MASTAAPAAPEELGMGYDRIQRGMLEYSAVAGKQQHTAVSDSSYDLYICESARDVAKALNIDTSVSASYLSVASASVKSQFVDSLKLTTRSVTIVVYAHRETAKWALKQAKLDGADKPTTPDELADFVGGYGDSFVSEVVQGAEYFAAYSLHMETSEQQNSFALQAKAALNTGSVKVDAEVQTKLSSLLTSSSKEVTFRQRMSGVEATYPTEKDAVEFARNFPALPVKTPKTLRFKAAGYEEIPGLRTAFAATVKARAHFLGTVERPGLYAVMDELKGLRNQVEWIKGIYNCYNFAGDTDLASFRDGLEKDIDALDEQIEAYAANPATEFVKPAPKSFDKGEPQLQIEHGKEVEFGGTGGNAWNFMSTDEAIRKRVRIVGIRFGGEDCIERLEIDYKTPTAPPWTDAAGTGEHYWLTTNLAPGADDFIKKVHVRAGQYIDRLRIELSNGEAREAGGTGGGANDWTVPVGSVVLGFQGRRGKYLDRLHIVHAKLKNAKFVKP